MTKEAGSAQTSLETVARQLIWWQDPARTLARPERLVAQAMTLGTWEDVQVVLGAYGEGAFRRVLAAPPPGVFDRRSWAYWHERFGIRPIPPLPRRFR
jgi:hypothetical protein